MTPVPFSALYNQVLPYLPGAETPIVDSQIRKVLREFMQRTTLQRETFVVPTVPGTSVYLLTPSFGQVSAIMQVRFQGERIDPVPEDRRDAVHTPGEPLGWYSTVPHLLTLYPTPTTTYTTEIEVDAAITLKQDDTTFPDDLFNQYAEAIGAGVIGVMMGMPGKPWTAKQDAVSYNRIFAGKIRDLRGRLRDGGQPNQSTFIAARKFGV